MASGKKMLGILLGLVALLVGSGLVLLAILFPSHLKREFKKDVANRFIRGPLLSTTGATGNSFASLSSLEVERTHLSTITNVEQVLLK